MNDTVTKRPVPDVHRLHLSVACLRGWHERCHAKCKHCDVPCGCDCHAEEAQR